MLQVKQATNGVARFAFEELCNRTLGAADYIAVAQAFHTVFLTDIPTMSLKVSGDLMPHVSTCTVCFDARNYRVHYITAYVCAMAMSGTPAR